MVHSRDSLRSKRFRGRSRKSGFSALATREMKRAPKNETFTYAIFRAVFDSRSSFFAPKPRGNASYAGYSRDV